MSLKKTFGHEIKIFNVEVEFKEIWKNKEDIKIVLDFKARVVK